MFLAFAGKKDFNRLTQENAGVEVGISAKSLVGWCFETWWLAKSTLVNLTALLFALCALGPAARLPSTNLWPRWACDKAFKPGYYWIRASESVRTGKMQSANWVLFRSL